ncbi:MAG: ElyC/SanA/YdcF family protein [Verrucomicrobiota bacterium]
MSRFFRPGKVIPFLFLCLAILGCFVAWCDRHVINEARGHHFDNLEHAPSADVALVLGCARVLSNGRANRFFTYRMEMAADAFNSGKCRYLIVSGDHGRPSYNEPESMRRELIRLGVPEDRIICDYAGFRTLDSVIRAQQVFGQRELIVISQRFHNERAIYIARHHSLKLVGLNAKSPSRKASYTTRARESLARVMMMLDLHLLGTKPRFLGEPIRVAFTSL